jgi:hypothetical protein
MGCEIIQPIALVKIYMLKVILNPSFTLRI